MDRKRAAAGLPPSVQKGKNDKPLGIDRYYMGVGMLDTLEDSKSDAGCDTLDICHEFDDFGDECIPIDQVAEDFGYFCSSAPIPSLDDSSDSNDDDEDDFRVIEPPEITPAATPIPPVESS